MVSSTRHSRTHHYATPSRRTTPPCRTISRRHCLNNIRAVNCLCRGHAEHHSRTPTPPRRAESSNTCRNTSPRNATCLIYRAIFAVRASRRCASSTPLLMPPMSKSAMPSELRHAVCCRFTAMKPVFAVPPAAAMPPARHARCRRRH